MHFSKVKNKCRRNQFCVIGVVAAAIFSTPLAAVEMSATQCLPDSKLEKALAQTNRPLQDADLYITAKDFLSIENPQDYVIVDVRHPDEYNQYWIAGSMNMRSHVVQHSLSLKDKPVLLVNNGWQYAELEKTAKALQANTSKPVYILFGGIPVWHEQLGKLEGSSSRAEALQELPAKHYISEWDYGSWLVVDFSKDSHQQSFPAGYVHMKSGDLKELQSRVKEKLSGSKLTRVLILGHDKPAEVSEALKRFDSPVFALNDGTKGFKQFMQNQEALLVQKLTRSENETLARCRG